MIRPVITLRRKRIIIDIDTQYDFLCASGKNPIRNHRRVLANIRRVMAWARHKNIRMISTAEVYEPGNGKDYCLDSTPGQQKVSYTLRDNCKVFPADGNTDLPRDIFKIYDQVVLNKRCENPFDEPRADRMLSELKADEFIIFGVTLESAVKSTALGLLMRKKHVTLINDAIGYHDKNSADIALRQIEAKGAKIIDSKQIFGSSHLRQVHACGCDRCMGLLSKEENGMASKTG